MAQDLAFGCACGEITGALNDITPRSGARLKCHCEDCRRAAIWIGEDDPAPAGMDYYQTTPDHVNFHGGLENLRVMTWKSPRLLRWYAPCCGSVMFNTMNTPKWAFASLNTARLADPAALGLAKTVAFKPVGNGKTRTMGLSHFIPGFIRRSLRARLSGDWRDTPFFTEDGQPIAPPQELDRARRATVTV